MRRLASSLLLGAVMACATTVQTFTLNPSNVPGVGQYLPPSVMPQTQVAITPEDGLGHTYLVMVVLPNGMWLVQVVTTSQLGSANAFFATVDSVAIYVWEVSTNN